MFTNQIFQTVISVNLRDCVKIDENILREIQQIEGYCISCGYVKPGSVSIVSRSIGKTNTVNNSGDIYYNVVFSADIFKPFVVQKLNCVVEKINKLGLMAYGEQNLPICVIIARQHHEKSFKECKEKEHIQCEVVGSRYNINDKEIQIIGKFL